MRYITPEELAKDDPERREELSRFPPHYIFDNVQDFISNKNNIIMPMEDRLRIREGMRDYVIVVLPEVKITSELNTVISLDIRMNPVEGIEILVADYTGDVKALWADEKPYVAKKYYESLDFFKGTTFKAVQFFYHTKTDSLFLYDALNGTKD